MGRGSRTRAEAGPAILLRQLPEGASLYLVGGAVREQLLGQSGGDWDLALGGVENPEAWLQSCGNAEPLEIAGERVGWRLRAPWTPREGVEIALLRRESSSGPRHTDFLVDTKGITIEEDLGRRDFTCNAVAIDLRSGKVHDPWGGQEDIRKGKLRALGEHVFREDPLRVLRGAVRVARDRMRADEQTIKWMRQANLRYLSPERIWGELQKIIDAPGRAEALGMLREAGALEQIAPEVVPTWGFSQESRYHELDCDEHCLEALRRVHSENPAVFWAAWLHDAGKPLSAWRGEDGNLHYYENPKVGKRDHAEEGALLAERILERLRAPRALREEVVYLIRNHMWSDARGWTERSPGRRGIVARRFLHRHGPHWRSLLELRRADAAAKGRDASKELQQLDEFEAALEEEDARPWRLADLPISGDDLVRLGLRGEAVGKALQEIQDRIIDNPHLGQRERLLEWARRLASKENAEIQSPA